jgi:ribonuclease P protein component
MRGAFGYPKAARVRRRQEFLTLQGSGQRRHTAHLVFIRQASGGPGSRLGVTVSKRVGAAVVRSRVKRLIREVFRQRRAEISPALDLVVIAKPGADTLTYAQAATEFAHALNLRRRL